MVNIQNLMFAMIDFYQGDSHQVQHFIKVHSFARTIAIGENMSEEELEVLEVASLVHDIGIKPAMIKYGNGTGKFQEELGPDEAIKMLSNLGYSKQLIDRVAYLVGHHHTYTNIDGLDYQILVEADFLVNLHEKNSNQEAIKSAYNKIFKTNTGKKICQTMLFRD